MTDKKWNCPVFLVLLGLGYMTSRARRWLTSDVLPRDFMEQPARKMIAGEIELLDLIVQQIKQFNKPILPVIDVVGFDDPDEGNSNIISHLTRWGSWPTHLRSRPSAHWPRRKHIIRSCGQGWKGKRG